MNIDLRAPDGYGPAVEVSLSERNLRDLLAQYESGSNSYLRSGSNANGTPAKAQLVRRCAQADGRDVLLTVVVQDDAAHYGERVPGPGGVRA